MAVAAGFSFRVKPEDLQRKASEFTDIINRLQRHFDSIEDISSRTRGYWRGEAGDKDREGYASYKDDISYILGRPREHPTDLLKMADLYNEAEMKAREISSELKTDQIV